MHEFLLILTPAVFGPKHLYGTVVTLLIVALLLVGLLVVGKMKNHRLVLRVAAVILLILEVMKQAKAVVDGGWYPLWALPFQLCSVPIYLFPIVAFGKERLARFVMPGTFTIALFAALAMLSYPSTVLGGTDTWVPLIGNYYPLVSFSFHGVMVFFSMYLLFSKTYVPSWRDYPRAYLTMVAFAIVAILANLIWGTDMMFLNTAYGMPLGFILYDYGRAAYWIFMAVLAFVVLAIPFVPSFIHGARQKRKAAD